MPGPLTLLPRGALVLAKEVARHILRRPVVGLCVVARRSNGDVLLIRRADTGTWALPGGTVEWGETLVSTAHRELDEEAGARVVSLGPVLGVFSRPDRDPRFHAVTTVVAAVVDDEARGPKNPLEIREARFFADGALPGPLAMGCDDFLAAERAPRPVLE